MDKIKIVTHNMRFHADDVFAVAVLSLYFQDKYEIEIIRTRDEAEVSSADYVVDVGGIYDEEKNRFDHHQIEGSGFRENKIPYASFGLVWKKFGEKLCENIEVAERVDKKLICPIDAVDCGVKIRESVFKGINSYDIGEIVDTYLPALVTENPDYDAGFMECLKLAKHIIKSEIERQKNLVKIRKVVLEAYEKSDDKRLIVLDGQYPADEFLAEFPEPLFFVVPRSDGTWSLKTIRDDKRSFNDRKRLPESWAGKRNEDLERVTGVSGAMFCQSGLFLVVANTKEAILKLAEIALNS